MVTKSQVEQALINVNHNTTAIREGISMLGAQHNDLLGEVQRTNNIMNKNSENNFYLLKLLIKSIISIAIGALGLKVGGLI